MNDTTRTPVHSPAVYRRAYGRKASRPVGIVDRPQKSVFLVTRLYLGMWGRRHEK